MAAKRAVVLSLLLLLGCGLDSGERRGRSGNPSDEGDVAEAGGAVEDTGRQQEADSADPDDTGTPQDADQEDSSTTDPGGSDETPEQPDTSRPDTSAPDVGPDTSTAPDVPQDSPPQIIRFSATRDEMSPGDAVSFSVIATDADGVETLLGGVIEDVDGFEYGLLVTSGGEGSYSLDTTWGAIHDTHDVTAPPGGIDRIFVARVYDASGNEATSMFTIVLTCGSEAVCSGDCIDIETNPDHCGDCNDPLPSGWDTCEDGLPSCVGEREYCDGACVDTQSSDEYCGSCTTPLPSGWDECAGGEPICYSGREYCDSACTDTDHDELHCGECDHACLEESFCADGDCRQLIYSSNGDDTCAALCSAAGLDCLESTERYSLRDSCTCEGVGCFEGDLECDQSPNSRLDFCEEPGSFTTLSCLCSEPL